MSLGAVLGTLLGLLLVIGSIMTSTDNYRAFLNLHGFLIVAGGSLALAFMSYPTPQVMRALKAIVDMVKKPESLSENLKLQVFQIIEWAYLIQSKGLPGLEDVSGDVKRDPILRFGLELVATDYPPKEIERMIQIAADADHEKRVLAASILKNMGGAAPAFGMVGTLVGMVIMFGNLSSDISQIGEGVSIALLATLYGVVSARLLYLPAAEKLIFKADLIRFRYYLVAEGLALLVDSKSPRYIQDKLNSYIDPALHFDLDEHLSHFKQQFRT